MPGRRRQLRVCEQPGCAELGPGRWCAAHTPARPPWRPPGGWPKRPSPASLGYGRRWAALSRRVRRQRPVCETPGCQARSAHVDHVDGDRSNWAEGNLQALCRSCHSLKTVRHDGGFGRPRTPRG